MHYFFLMRTSPMDTSRSRRHHPEEQRRCDPHRERLGLLFTGDRSYPVAARPRVQRRSGICEHGIAWNRALDRPSLPSTSQAGSRRSRTTSAKSSAPPPTRSGSCQGSLGSIPTTSKRCTGGATAKRGPAES